MSGNKYPKKFQVHLTEAQHEALRQAAFEAKVSMMECVRRWIGKSAVVKHGEIPGDNEVRVQPPKPKWVPPVIDQSTCKHPKFMPNPEGLGTKCVRCGWEPPL